MTSYSESFIPGAMNKLCAGKTNSHFTNLANYIAGFTNDSTPIDVALAKAVFECQSAEQEAPFHTFAVLGFFQTIMDRVMWNARKLRIAMDRASQQQEESGGIYGVDLAQSAIDDVEVNVNFDRIKDVVQSDYELLFTTQTLIMSELAIDGEQFGIDLLFFNPSNLDETSGQWVQDTPADTYDDAMRVMQEIVDDLKAADNKTLMAGYLKNREAVLAARLAA